MASSTSSRRDRRLPRSRLDSSRRPEAGRSPIRRPWRWALAAASAINRLLRGARPLQEGDIGPSRDPALRVRQEISPEGVVARPGPRASLGRSARCSGLHPAWPTDGDLGLRFLRRGVRSQPGLDWRSAGGAGRRTSARRLERHDAGPGRHDRRRPYYDVPRAPRAAGHPADGAADLDSAGASTPWRLRSWKPRI